MRAALIASLLIATAQAAPREWCFSPDGPWLVPKHDGFDWIGTHWQAHVSEGGDVEFFSLRVRGDAGFSSADERRWFLDETEELRAKLAAARHEHDLDGSLRHLPGLLGSVWRDSQWSIDERRRILFAIWDEAAEPSDRELGAAGRRARAIIDEFVRKNLPEGSPLGFGAGELAQLNARRAQGPRFDPYHSRRDVDRDP